MDAKALAYGSRIADTVRVFARASGWNGAAATYLTRSVGLHGVSPLRRASAGCRLASPASRLQGDSWSSGLSETPARMRSARAG